MIISPKSLTWSRAPSVSAGEVAIRNEKFTLHFQQINEDPVNGYTEISCFFAQSITQKS